MSLGSDPVPSPVRSPESPPSGDAGDPGHTGDPTGHPPGHTVTGGREVLHLTAFSADPRGGNPAGVVPDSGDMTDSERQALATRLGYSETAFLAPPPPDLDAPPGHGFSLRFFSPLAEVPFCGHATIATAVAMADRVDGAGGSGVRGGPAEAIRLVFATPAGVVPVSVTRSPEGPLATLTSVPAEDFPAPAGLVAGALAALGWSEGELDPSIPPRIAFAGARHLVLAAAGRDRLADIGYDTDRLTRLMLAHDLTTVTLMWRLDATTLLVRNPFPVGGVVEDPATGAAAAALGGYLRSVGVVAADARLTIHQGVEMGRPSVLSVELRAGDPRVRVSGTAARVPVS
ncbi:PhzF family phenazine biosynthesis protein [Streptomyces sp. ST2-7A]|uniref:PhzF family phenazine biosynthesis protein n=1 Tax=Streptomyces sp. ST2-7A TaxID=2907214 RepID=UPI001F31AED6|nr:PhzF family phenazine biosynthesis isomerase [Streptomyces sp. ST2-7A]MCE7081320.1 PhzF family phenazine biosynthesis protein [Streptomyces sp. ST2-7A]